MSETFWLVVKTAGGTAIIIAGLVAWLGTVWAKRIEQRSANRYAHEIELLKAAIEKEKSKELRISDAKFRLYTEVWSCLQDVKTIGDRLWERASRNELHYFREALLKAKTSVNRGRLILLDKHYDKLNKLLEAFGNYEIGKKKLVDIRSNAEFDEVMISTTEYDIERVIKSNGQYRDQYEHLLDDICPAFRRELGLSG